MKQEAGIANQGAAASGADGDEPHPAQALRQWRDTLLRCLDRPAPDASIDDRHGLLLELARCALALRETGPDATPDGVRHPPFPGGAWPAPAPYAGPGDRFTPEFSVECATAPTHTATVRHDTRQTPPWQTSIPHSLPNSRS
ncbi:hypothetical protein [Cupriavidus yeoncheonensis]|uniref:hypothetical protein n=1 Tax=Cupriavidus yeoncheonensis TaxID=1462994 RepID=UPI001BABF761|nr:hypothetical protein [Cupriavidus yeoncheonensis]